MADELDILLVEDTGHEVELALRAQRKHHLANRIHVARDGEEALDFIFCRGSYSSRDFGQFPRLILLDLKLPKLDGMEVLRQLKDDARTRAIPVAILTASKEETDMSRGYSLGVNSYIQKPVDFDQFCKTVTQLGMYWLLVNQLPSHLDREPAGARQDRTTARAS
jgi:two-component system, response regulator